LWHCRLSCRSLSDCGISAKNIPCHLAGCIYDTACASRRRYQRHCCSTPLKAWCFQQDIAAHRCGLSFHVAFSGCTSGIRGCPATE
jgi:hypothetical protein